MKLRIPFIGSIDAKKALLMFLYAVGSFAKGGSATERRTEVSVAGESNFLCSDNLIREYIDSAVKKEGCHNSVNFIASAKNPFDMSIMLDPLRASRIDGIQAEVHQYQANEHGTEVEIHSKKVKIVEQKITMCDIICDSTEEKIETEESHITVSLEQAQNYPLLKVNIEAVPQGIQCSLSIKPR